MSGGSTSEIHSETHAHEFYSIWSFVKKILASITARLTQSYTPPIWCHNAHQNFFWQL